MQTLRMVLARALAVALVFVSGIASAQTWEVRSILSNVQQPMVRLTVTKDGNVTTVDTVQRAWIQRVATVTERLAPAYGLPAPDQYIVKQSGPNAFVTFYKDQPAMFVNTDMLKMVGDDDDLMAAVIGHELGHLKANHLTDGKARSAAVTLLSVLAGLAVDITQAKRGVDTGGLGTQVGALGGDLVNAKFSRDQEREADDIGLRSMASVGYDPNAAPRLWKRMEAEGGGGNGLWLSSHPSSSERFQTLQLAAAKLTVTPPTTYAATTVSDPYPISDYKSLALTEAELAAAEPSLYRKGVEALRAQDYSAAFTHFTSAAILGDERAMASVGDAYLLGRGVDKDVSKAYEQYWFSASKGFAPAIFMLAESAQMGRGRSQDTGEAMRLFTVAESRGLPRATARMGMMYLTGSGVDKDPVKARELTKRAADNGDILGKAAYGAMLRDGVGGPADVAKGFELLSSVPSDHKIGYAHYQLGLTYERGIGTAADKEKAADSYRKALVNGVPVAKQRLEALGLTE